ncbi:MAG: T9SS type A sorting domain-containing protein [Bacteroides sp.]
MSLRNISRVALVLLLPLLLGWSTDASAGMRKKLNFVKNPDGGTVKVEFNSNGTWKEKNPGEDVLNGAQLKITATPDSGKEFESMQVNGKDVTNKVKTEGTASVYNCYAAGESGTDVMNIVVAFKTPGQVNKHKLTFTNPEGATVKVTVDGQDKPSDSEIEAGKDLVISVKVTDNTQQVKSVKLNATEVAKDGDNWKAKMPNEAATLVVTLEEKPAAQSMIMLDIPEGVELKIEDVSEATPKPVIPNQTKVMEGTALEITVTKKPEGKLVDKVLFDNEELEEEGGKYKTDMEDHDVTIKVTLKQDPAAPKYAFTFAGTADFDVTAKKGTETLTSPAQVAVGEDVTLTITLKVGVTKSIKSVKVGDVVAKKGTAANEWMFTMPGKAAELAVELVEAEKTHKVIFANGEDYTIGVTNISGGAQSINTGEKVAEGTELLAEITVTNPKKEVKVVKANTTDATKGADANHWTFTMGTEDITLTVELQDKTAPQPGEGNVLTIEANGTTVKVMNGTTEVKSGDKVAKDVKLTVEVSNIPADKEIEKVTLNEVEMTLVEGKYEGNMPDAAATLKVVLKEKGAPQPGEGNLIKVTANGATVKIMAGTTEVKADTKVKAGTDLVITVTAPAGKVIDNVSFNNTVVKPEANKSYKVKMSATEATLVVNLKKAAAVEDAVLAGVVAYPNPMVRELVVSNLAEVENVALVNAQGVVVRAVKPNGASELRLAVEDLSAGVYMLVVERNGVRKAIRIVK